MLAVLLESIWSQGSILCRALLYCWNLKVGDRLVSLQQLHIPVQLFINLHKGQLVIKLCLLTKYLLIYASIYMGDSYDSKPSPPARAVSLHTPRRAELYVSRHHQPGLSPHQGTGRTTSYREGTPLLPWAALLATLAVAHCVHGSPFCRIPEVCCLVTNVVIRTGIKCK